MGIAAGSANVPSPFPGSTETVLFQGFAVAMSKPFVESIFWSDLIDHPGSEIPTSALLTDSDKPRPVLSKLVNMRKRLRKPLGPMKEHRLNALRESL